ncbi:chorismate mutase [Halomicrobium salinisoli]|uniref:chorismate mutase n=1 Tax=Halomicrobium salinisoli TaxID=2878391 RepID=UPI001CF02581|nr:chorismate mutase [Halomicrobium salinisoli]
MTSSQPEGLEALRDQIDGIDAEVAELVAERLRVAEEVAAVKAEAGAAVVDVDREADVKSHYEEAFQRAGVDPEYGRDLAAYLIERSIEREEAVTTLE